MEKATKAAKGRRWMADERLIPLEDDCTGFPEALSGGRRVRDVRFVHQKEGPEVQRHMAFNPGGKSIRMDVYFEDPDAVYGMELQRTDEGDLPRRARMYSSYMDTGILGKGMDYRSLRDSYVIFVCRFDPFGRGRKAYTYRMSKGEAIGISKGISKGVAEEKRRMVRSLREQSVPLEVIAKAASLSVEEVQGIK